MEETRVNVEDDANDHVDDVVAGEDFDSSQPKARSRKSYTVGFKLVAVDKFDQLGALAGKIHSFTTACRCTSRYNGTLVKFLP